MSTISRFGRCLTRAMTFMIHFDLQFTELLLKAITIHCSFVMDELCSGYGHNVEIRKTTLYVCLTFIGGNCGQCSRLLPKGMAKYNKTLVWHKDK